MSLLLEARKKSQQAQAGENSRAPATPEIPLQENTAARGISGDSGMTSTSAHRTRNIGQNLFNAKSPSPAEVHGAPNKYLLLALGLTLLLLGAGAIYLWYLNSASNTTQLHPAPPVQHFEPMARPVPGGNVAQPSMLVPGVTASQVSAAEAAAPSAEIAAPGARSTPSTAPVHAANVSATVPQPPREKPSLSGEHSIHIEPQRTNPDRMLEDAYFAYRNGKPDEAQQLYLALFRKDARNTDALLGLAAIAQQRGDDRTAAHYYAQVLALDPRNALANAGMSALSADSENNESRLKLLLREQGNSAALHFALGNLFAGQSRWGEAQQAYFNAYTLESGNAEYTFNLAVSLDHLGQARRAAQHYQQALRLDSSHSAGFDHALIARRIQQLKP